jgi:hypothetical protein
VRVLEKRSGARGNEFLPAQAESGNRMGQWGKDLKLLGKNRKNRTF